jgi:hypothetical protein
MANFVFGTTGCGRVGEYVNRVLGNDPANSALIAIPMSQSGTAEQAEALTTFAAVEADANFAEQAAGSWGRKTLDETGDRGQHDGSGDLLRPRQHGRRRLGTHPADSPGHGRDCERSAGDVPVQRRGLLQRHALVS